MSVAAPPDALVSAVRAVLKPLIGVLVANGLTYTYLTRLLKALYVEVAEESFGVSNKRLTDSRISLLTGVHRKDVRVLRDQIRDEFRPPPSVNIGSKVVDKWITDPTYLDTEGHSVPLARTGDKTAVHSFDGLVDLVSRDLHPRTVLDELQRLGIVRIDANDMVHLNANAFVPREGLDELLYFFGSNLHDHVAAAAHNLAGNEPPYIELATYNVALSDEAIETLRTAARDAGHDALVAIDKLAQDLTDDTQSSDTTANRMRFGVYFYAEPKRATSP